MRCLLCLVLCAGVGVLAGCGEEPRPVVRIGLLAPLTGEGSPLGVSARLAAQGVVAQVNAAGGVSVGGQPYLLELLVADTASRPDEAVSGFLRLADADRVVAVVGPLHGASANGVAEAAQVAGVPLVVPATADPALLELRPFVLHAGTVLEREAVGAARVALGEGLRPTAGVIFDIGDDTARHSARAFRRAFEDAGGRVLAYETYTTTNDMEPEEVRMAVRVQARNVAEAGVEVVYVPHTGRRGALLIEMARSAGYDGPVVGRAMLATTTLADECGADCANVRFVAPLDPAATASRWPELCDGFREATGQLPDAPAALTFDAMQLALTALTNVQNVDDLERMLVEPLQLRGLRVALREGLANTQEFDGAQGRLRVVDGQVVRCLREVAVAPGNGYRAMSVLDGPDSGCAP